MASLSADSSTAEFLNLSISRPNNSLWGLHWAFSDATEHPAKAASPQ